MGLLDSKWVFVLYALVMVASMLRWAWNMLWPPQKWDHVVGFLALMAFASSWVAYSYGDRKSGGVLSLIWILWSFGVVLHVLSEVWLPKPVTVHQGWNPSPSGVDLGVFSDGWRPVEQDWNPRSSKTRKRQARRRRLKGRRG